MLIIDLLAAHMVGDFILQTDYEARYKLDNWRVRMQHVSKYCLPFGFALLDTPLPRAAAFLMGLWISHFVVDSRRWVSGEKWAPKPILVDQTLHLASLACLTRILTPRDTNKAADQR